MVMQLDSLIAPSSGQESMEPDNPKENSENAASFAPSSGKESSETGNPKGNNKNTLEDSENELFLPPISPGSFGVGLPYAPENWPNQGDNWRWKVGTRVASHGHFLDRYLYPPDHFVRLEGSTRRMLASKLAAERYVQVVLPSESTDEFFKLFSWKIPAKGRRIVSNGRKRRWLQDSHEEKIEHAASGSKSGGPGCKAGNKMCCSLIQEDIIPLAVMHCDLCCSEPRFCRDCCCILCSKPVSSDYDGYSYVKCEALVGEGYICGHLAHIDCALKCYMAGTVGGSIGLDAEYYCRRCDARTDMVLHVAKMLETSASVNSGADVQKILELGLRVLRGSQKESAKVLMDDIELVIKKLKSGTPPEDNQEEKDGFLAYHADASHRETVAPVVRKSTVPFNEQRDSENILSISSDYKAESQKLDIEIQRTLLSLKKAQEVEFASVKERLARQKICIHELYQQLDKERSELSNGGLSADSNVLLSTVLNRVDEIKREVMKLKKMTSVANGFSKTSKTVLKDHFGIEFED